MCANNPPCVALCVTGGIAAYKAATLASLFVKDGWDVHVAMTKNACAFIQPLTFETIVKRRAIWDSFSREAPFEVSHVSLAKRADLIVVAPATANVIAKAAAGLADDFVTTLLLAARSPVLFAPAMNTAMYKNPVVQENIARLKQRGALFVGPETGMLACGDEGEGRMCPPEYIREEAARILKGQRDLDGLNVLVTGGATIEPIDDVRYLTNRSTGRMGAAVASAAYRRGAAVTYICGQNAVCPPGVECARVESAQDMYEAVLAAFDSADIVVKAAAVADYTPEKRLSGKLKKQGDMLLSLKRTPDILSELGERKQGQVLVGFAAEASDIARNAKDKLIRKRLDLILANDISRKDAGFASDQNEGTLYFFDGREEHIGLCSKLEMADRILDAALELRRSRRTDDT